jgi:hypothetical protein
MAAGNLPLLIEEGATFKKTLVWKDSGKTVIDLTNYIARMQIRESIEDASFLLELTTANTRITLTPLQGKIELEIDATDLMALSWGAGVYDLELENTVSGFVKRLVKGKVTVDKEVTR